MRFLSILFLLFGDSVMCQNLEIKIGVDTGFFCLNLDKDTDTTYAKFVDGVDYIITNNSNFDYFFLFDTLLLKYYDESDFSNVPGKENVKIPDYKFVHSSQPMIMFYDINQKILKKFDVFIRPENDMSEYHKHIYEASVVIEYQDFQGINKPKE